MPRPVRLTGFTDRTFGVELEFLFGTGSGAARNMQAVATHLRAAGLNLTSVGTYTHAVGNGWQLVPDGSVYGGAELVSPILSGADGLAQVRKASEGLVAVAYGADGRSSASMVEVNCETDFVAKNDNFQAFVSDLVGTVAASSAADLEAARKESERLYARWEELEAIAQQ